MMLRNAFEGPEARSTNYLEKFLIKEIELTHQAKSCSTSQILDHSSGWITTILLDHKGSQSPWRSGEELEGKIELTRNHSIINSRSIVSLIVRCFWQSTTLYASPSLFTTSNTKSRKGLMEKVEVNQKKEYHRGYVLNGGEGTELWEEAGHLDGITREVEGDFPLLGDRIPGPSTLFEAAPLNSSQADDDHRSFEFKFILPTATKSNHANLSPAPPSDRGDLINLTRTPPPSFSSDSYSNGGVEWIVEAILVLSDADPSNTAADTTAIDSPSFEEPPSLTTPSTGNKTLDSHGLIQSTPLLLSNRISFPFEPLDIHQPDYYNTSSSILSIGRDARNELGGTPRVQFEEGGVYLSKEIVEREGGKEQWDTYEKNYIIKSSNLGRDVGVVRSEVSFPIALSLTRYSASLLLLFSFSYTPIITKSIISSTTNTPKPIYLDKVIISLYERILTRSGSALRPSMNLKELRKEVHLLGRGGDGEGLELKGSSKQSKGLKILPSISSQPLITSSIKLSFDLQSKLESTTHSSTSLKDCGVTFRVPNLEREYFISIMLEIGDKKGIVQIGRVPVMILVGDNDEVPSWESNEAFENEVIEMDRVEGLTERVREEGGAEDGLPVYV